ncbi:lysophospholipase L1-like esterase [Salinibacter ruber]|jgi:lysophospholipase L1-like esterase|uniref:SGNH/GDSL hydrolase family protein n=1 Tax=Salinibacter ruber TaxID=146919 RepID=UPI0021699F35|nr:GDSL-type esterase/lipase family protein [Salinibacter ruber]MCS3632047.1 lysophospholipase L1-like esterase [Salinibacter ruber]MCS3635880.1 lysophospholipase L1-like esterase [Salinibacter ruber]MCS3715446.1 lysophospholipase L1-like esterase [Salinibacter ruber]MCS3940329.1 lysophospholipase L1-like esterase [Salinibacter ruber]
MSHLVLLGDSVFDNGAYVEPGQPDVADQVRSQVSGNPEVTPLATDGHYVSDVPRQLERLPGSATHLFLSVGGNDGLRYLDSIGRLNREVESFTEAIRKLRAIQSDFRESYRSVVWEVLGAGLPTTLCTVYNGNFLEEERQDLVDTILPTINDVIIEVGIEKGLPLIDLGRTLDEPALDYANPIEPAAHGGEKIAEAIEKVLSSHDFGTPRAEIYT